MNIENLKKLCLNLTPSGTSIINAIHMADKNQDTSVRFNGISVVAYSIKYSNIILCTVHALVIANKPILSFISSAIVHDKK